MKSVIRNIEISVGIDFVKNCAAFPPHPPLPGHLLPKGEGKNAMSSLAGGEGWFIPVLIY